MFLLDSELRVEITVNYRQSFWHLTIMDDPKPVLK